MLSETEYEENVWKKYSELNHMKHKQKDNFYNSQCYRKYKKNNFYNISKLVAIFTSIIIGTGGLVYAGINTYEHFFQKTSSTGYNHNYVGPMNDKYKDISMQYTEGFYYKKIMNYEDYLEVKQKLKNLGEFQEDEFKHNFLLIIIADSNEMPGINITKVETKDNSLLIEVDKNSKEETNLNKEYMVSSLIGLEYNKENIIITKKINNISSKNFQKIESLPLNYSLQDARKDNCIIVDKMEIELSDKEKIENFVSNTQANQEDFIRIICNEEEIRGNQTSITIIDIQYISGQYRICFDYRRKKFKSSDVNDFVYETFDEISIGKLDKTIYTLRLQNTYQSTATPIIVYK